LKNASFRVSQSRDGYYADNVVPQEKEKPSVPRITSRTEDAPVLVTPIAQALLSPPDKNEWRFTWDEVPNAIRYEIEIYAPRVEAPVVKAQSRTTQYVVGRAFRYAVVHGEGWSWKLRAQQPDGSWSAWSETRPFNVFITERSPL